MRRMNAEFAEMLQTTTGRLLDKITVSKAILKKKFVSCPPGGHNSGQSGGCKIFFFLNIFFPVV